MYNFRGDPRCYATMLTCSRPVSRSHFPMSQLNRAAQFAPFDALTGFGAAIREKARQTEQQRELTEEEKLLLNRQLQRLREGMEILVCHFLPDPRKDGGSYCTATGRFRKLDGHLRLLFLTDGTEIPIEAISRLELQEPEFFSDGCADDPFPV